MRLPKIESLDLRTREGQRLSALLAFQKIVDVFISIYEYEDAWIEWDEISWEDTRHSGRVK